MGLYELICNICFCESESLKNIYAQNDTFKNILLSIMGNPEIININVINACSSCCEELTRIDNIREINHNNFLHFQQLKSVEKPLMEALQTSKNNASSSIVPDNNEDKTVSETFIKNTSTTEMSGQFETIFLNDNIKVEVESVEYVDTNIYENDRDAATKIVSEELETNQIVLKNNDIKLEVEYNECRSDATGNLDDGRSDIKTTKLEDNGLLESHTRIDTGKRAYKCITCERSFRNKSNLDEHTRIHTGVKPYKCNTCEKSFTQKSALGKHTRVHTGERPYKCNTCDRSFKQKSDLVRHTLVHREGKSYLDERTQFDIGNRPYKCNTCNRSFKKKSNLDEHTRIHTGEKPYKCSICDRRFSQSSALIHHTRTHTGERPYKCNMCERSFKQKSDLVRHVRIHRSREAVHVQ